MTSLLIVKRFVKLENLIVSARRKLLNFLCLELTNSVLSQCFANNWCRLVFRAASWPKGWRLMSKISDSLIFLKGSFGFHTQLITALLSWHDLFNFFEAVSSSFKIMNIRYMPLNHQGYVCITKLKILRFRG